MNIISELDGNEDFQLNQQLQNTKAAENESGSVRTRAVCCANEQASQSINTELYTIYALIC